MKKKIAILLTVLVAGCATQPSNLSATHVPVLAYANYDCDQLVSEAVHINRRISELYTSLKKKADNDAVQMGIGLLLFWPTLFALEGGDGPEATEYSNLKGSYEAIRQVSIQKKCPLDSIPGFKTPEEFKEENESS